MRELEVGAKVKNPRVPEWGVGTVTEVKGPDVTVKFPGIGAKKIRTSVVPLEAVSSAPARVRSPRSGGVAAPRRPATPRRSPAIRVGGPPPPPDRRVNVAGAEALARAEEAKIRRRLAEREAEQKAQKDQIRATQRAASLFASLSGRQKLFLSKERDEDRVFFAHIFRRIQGRREIRQRLALRRCEITVANGDLCFLGIKSGLEEGADPTSMTLVPPGGGGDLREMAVAALGDCP